MKLLLKNDSKFFNFSKTENKSNIQIRSYENNSYYYLSVVNESKKNYIDSIVVYTEYDENAMRLPELIVIMIILALWALSLRKFVKNFDKIRTTHYREIPYKYKDPQNINQIRVVKNQSESVIFPKDPLVKKSRSYLADLNKISSYENESISSYQSKNLNFAEKKRNSESLASVNSKKYLYMKNQTDDRRESLTLEEKRRYYFKTKRKPSIKNRYKNSNLIDTSMLAPIIRRSLLDLHQKSVEHLNSNTNLSIKKQTIN